MKHIDQYEELYRAWIGEKNQNTYYKKMQKGGFSWPAFWLSDLVMITRKMFVESIILVLFVYLIATVLEILKVPLIVYRAGVVLLLVAIGFSYYYLYRWSIERKIKKYQKKGLSYEQQLEIAKKAGGDKITPTVIVMIIVEVVLVAFLTIGANWIITTIENAKGGNTNNYYVATEQNNINNYNNNITAERSIIGTWYDREKKTTLILNSDQTAELYTDDKTLIYIKGTYTLEQDMTNQIGDEYIITITTSNRTLEGQLYTESYTTKFSAVTENYQAMVMMNIITYNMYNFERIK